MSTTNGKALPQAQVYQAIELYKRFRKSAERSPKRPLHRDILDSKLVVTRGPTLDKLKKRKILSCAPFRHTCVVFWTDCKYKGQPMMETAGWKLAALLWDDVDQKLTLFQEQKSGEISLAPRAMTEELHVGMTHYLAVIWSGLADGNPDKTFWGKQQHYYTRDYGTAPPEYYVVGSSGYKYEEGEEYEGKRVYGTDARGSLRCMVKRSSKKKMKQEERDSYEERGWTVFDKDELLDDQTARLLLSKGHKDKRAGEWMVVKTYRTTGYQWQTYAGEELAHVPSTRISTI